MAAIVVTAYVSNKSAGAVADVVADVVGDDSGIARIVLGDAGFDLAHEVGADVGRFGEDAAAEAGEHRDQRAAEREPDERREAVGFRRLVTGVDRADDPVIAAHREQAEPHDEQSRHRTALEREIERRGDAAARRFGGADVRAHRDDHADEAGCAREHGADHESDRSFPAERSRQEEDDHEKDEGDDRDRPVLAPQERHRAFLDGRSDRLHRRITGRLLDDPVG
jgi:hypothetical protein